MGVSGGDEFVAFLFDTSSDEAEEYAHKIRMTIEGINKSMSEVYPAYNVAASASIGIVPIDGEGRIGNDRYKSLQEHSTMAEIKNYADYALYVAKNAGKGREYSLDKAWETDSDRALELAFKQVRNKKKASM